MINKPPPFKGLNIRIPIIMPIKGGGLSMVWVMSGIPCYCEGPASPVPLPDPRPFGSKQAKPFPEALRGRSMIR